MSTTEANDSTALEFTKRFLQFNCLLFWVYSINPFQSGSMCDLVRGPIGWLGPTFAARRLRALAANVSLGRPIGCGPNCTCSLP